MSRVGKCIDNGPMEGFWGILKRERYYGRRFTSREQLTKMIQEHITYYNFRRLQRVLVCGLLWRSITACWPRSNQACFILPDGQKFSRKV